MVHTTGHVAVHTNCYQAFKHSKQMDIERTYIVYNMIRRQMRLGHMEPPGDVHTEVYTQSHENSWQKCVKAYWYGTQLTLTFKGRTRNSRRVLKRYVAAQVAGTQQPKQQDTQQPK